jgi:hypothetical protein
VVSSEAIAHLPAGAVLPPVSMNDRVAVDLEVDRVRAQVAGVRSCQ